MAQSLSRVLVHLIFSTKNRVPILTPAIQSELHPFLATTLTNNGCPSLRVGGVQDHVHLFFGLSRTLSISQVVELVKVSSSKWIKTNGREFSDFHWQGGFGIVSVSQSNADDVCRYIDNQEQHHKTLSFQDELREFFRKYRVEFDERYVWD
jgi:REP element-mobilizing transposase RayT